MNKFDIQDSEYSYPYHYNAFMDEKIPRITRTLGWGFEYLTYMNYIINEMKNFSDKDILDVGCGDGYLLNNINNNSNKIGIDLSEKAISFANAFSKDAIFEVKNIFTIREEYDVVSLIEVLEHIPDELVEKFMTHILKIVKKEGFFIVSVPTTVHLLNPKHYRHYDEELLDKHINNFGDIELVQEKRIYKVSKRLSIVVRLLNNKWWTINSKMVLNIFWNWHLKNNLYANKTNGSHIVRIYRKN